MSTWNYRRVRIASGEIGVFEVYYNDKGEPTLRAYEPARIWIDEEDDTFILEAIQEAFMKSVLDDEIFDNKEVF